MSKKTLKTIEDNKNGIFLNWSDLKTHVQTLTNKDFFMCGTGAGNVHTVIIKNGKLHENKTKFHWCTESISNRANVPKLIEFINSAD